MLERYDTLAGETRRELDKIKGSRFLATAAPVSSRDDAAALLERVRAEHADARHHCFAWRRVESGRVEAFSSDAGEPSGSAGRPILQQLEGRSLVGAMVVVTRWFGGTKLGVGGLMRAYGAAAAEVLDRARVRRVDVTRRGRVEHPYDCSGAVQSVLSAAGIEPREAEYGARVRLLLDVPVARYDEVLAELRERTAGRADVGT